MNSSGNVGVKKSASSSYALDIDGEVRLNGGHSWVQFIFEEVSRNGYDMLAFSPSVAWRGILGTESNYFGYGYIKQLHSHAVQSEEVYCNNFYNNFGYTFSDRKIKSNIRDIESALDIILKMDGRKYDVKPPVHGLSKQKEGTLKKDDYGFIAQDFMKVLPELVKFDSVTSLYAINYTGLIPIIVEAMKDQQTTIDELTKRVEALEGDGNSIEKSASIETVNTTNKVAESCMLEQNIPNPFSDNTRIDMYLPESVSNAVMYIYNMQGKQIEMFKIQERGNTSVTISGYTLEAGMYLYTLIADGKEVDTKKMILTK